MLRWPNIRAYFTPCIPEQQFKTPLSIPDSEHDALALRLPEEFYLQIQVDSTRDAQLTVEEQLHWETNAKLPEPIENYCLATTIYNQEQDNIQALVAALAKTELQKILGHCQEQALLITEITSLDKQFCFYKKNISCFYFPVLLKKINQALLLLSLLLTLACSGILLWQGLTSASRQKHSQSIDTTLAGLEKDYAAQQAAEAQQQRLERNTQQLNKLIAFLEQLRLTPESIILEEVAFSPDKTIALRGSTKNPADIERFGKLLQKTSRKTTLVSSIKNNEQISFEYLLPGLAAKPKGKKHDPN